MVDNHNVKDGIIFPAGAPNDAYAAYFTGQSWLAPLATAPDGSVGIGNVTFEPGCRNKWHIHHHGYQILLITGGRGWYQEKGQPARTLEPGDVVITADGVTHWHGAAADSWFSHIAITSGETEWLDPVTDQEYDHLGH